MRQSKLFSKTLREAPKDAQTISHKLLVRAGFINQLTSGVWTLLPLGLRVHDKIANIIREEINAIGGQELVMPALQPKDLWQETGRWDTIDPPLFKIKNRHDKWLCLGPTHEEVITDLARQFINSYKDLPLAVYQIQNKFRNEMRPTGGLLRVIEFVMKDLYSFHANMEDLDDYFNKVVAAYYRIYERCGLKAVAVEASSGSIGGNFSYEFMVLANSGEDKIAICTKGDWGANLEVAKDVSKCPKCGGQIEIKNSIEASHAFKLGKKYSEKMKANFMNKDGKEEALVMGCYGIGLGRLLATIVEVSNDDKGIIWPRSVAPFDVHLIGLDLDDKKIAEKAEKVYQELVENGFDVLFDDRLDSPGIKFKDADLIGIPVRLIVSQKTGDKIEYKERAKKEFELIDIKKIIDKIKG
ncbi:MAG: proline--tRNA ligase [Patescibacteria group bacterium]|nr:proline--tRNA ligase [Patescibacteria group bacterium]MDD5121441.1 proline--tRNA ligase [Patescibacteria group bacterium]MDD5222199.1 proline--tRNA ligase [Patescibacteria group bacterium]MDD5396397.1 proline--tRNA ligase [Patescibacteria group bacterium]